MNLLTLIEEILQEKCIVHLKKTSFSLTESSPGNACEEVKVNVSGPCIVCRFESIMCCTGTTKVEISPYFNNLSNVKKMCDYIVFYKHKETDNKINVFLCELKGTSSYRLQLKAGYSFARFIIDAAKRYGESKQFQSNENIEYRGVAFTRTPFFKHTIDPKRKDYIKVDPASSKHIEYFEIECNRIVDSFDLHKHTY